MREIVLRYYLPGFLSGIALASIFLYFYYKNRRNRQQPVSDRENAGEKWLKARRLYSFTTRINHVIIRTSDDLTLFKEVCRIAVEVGKFKMAWFGEIDEDRKTVTPIHFDGHEDGYFSTITPITATAEPSGNGPTGRAIREGKYVVCNDFANDPGVKLWAKEALRRGYLSSISLPIKKNGRTIAAFTVYAGVKDFFDASEITLLLDAAADVSFALDFFEKEALRKKALLAVLESEHRYHTLAEISPVGIFHTDADGFTTYVNPRWCEISGMPATEALGNGWLKSVHPDDRPSLKEEWDHAVRTGMLSVYEYRFVQPDGSIAWVLGQAVQQRNELGKVIGFVGTITEITGRKKAEETIANNEKRFRALIENFSDGVAVIASDGTILDMTPSAKIILGYDREAFIGRMRGTDVHPEDLPAASRVFLSVRATPGMVGTTEYRYKMPNGNYRWLECTYTNLLDQPYLNGIVANYRDITDRKMAGIQLRESEERYRKAQAIGKMGHWEFDIATQALFWSDQIYPLFDIDKDAGKNIYEEFYKRIHPEDRKAHDEADALAVAGQKKLDIIHRIITGNGSIRYMHELGELSHDAQGRAYLTGTVQDVTEQVESRNAILIEKQLSDSIINSLPGIFYLYDKEGNLLRWNQSHAEITGYTAEELRSMHALDFCHPDDRQYIKDKMDSVFRNGEDDAEAGLYLKDRTRIPFYFTGRLIRYNGQECLIGVGIDLSEKIAAQEKIKKTSEELRQLAAHLQDVREEERATMAREIHDELGQQLTGLKMDIYWLKEGSFSDNKEYSRQIDAILQLVDQTIITVRNISAALRPSILDDLGLEEALASYCADFQHRFGMEVHFTAHLPDTTLPPKISIGLFRIFQECLTNIARHSGATEVRVDISSGNDGIRLNITDNGKGFIVAEIAKKKTLGLVGMKERVYMLGGKYEIDSESGKGTAIYISVPLPATPH